MSVVTIAALKAKYQTGDFPTEQDFIDLIDTLGSAGDSQIYSITISLTAAQIKTLSSALVDAIPAPGVGKAIQVLSCSASLVSGATPFTNTTINLITETATNIQFSSATILTSTTNSFQYLELFISGGINSKQIIDNKKLQIKANADSAVGDGTAKVYINYRILTL